MSYSALHQYFQDHTAAIPTGEIIRKTSELTGKTCPRIFMTDLDLKICRGFYLSARNQNHQFVRQVGNSVIVLGRGQNDCWNRFIKAKEAMHLFDDPLESTETGEQFDKLLLELSGGETSERSPQLGSEITCFWKALGILCPENERQHCLSHRKTMTDYDMALRLKIPEKYIPKLLSPSFPMMITLLTS